MLRAHQLRTVAVLAALHPAAPWCSNTVPLYALPRHLHRRRAAAHPMLAVEATEESGAVDRVADEAPTHLAAPRVAGLDRHLGGRSIGTKRVRQHVNPLRSNHQQPISLPERWPEHYFADPSLPLHLDIGCARGLFCLDHAAMHPAINILGLEIRKPLVDEASKDAKAMSLGNCAFLTSNANVHLDAICEGALPCTGGLASASVQFPDPWFKVRHHKRRVMQPELARALATNIVPGGWLLVQSDVFDVAEAMREVVREHASGLLVDARDDFDDWGVDKPATLASLPTEREIAGEKLGRPVYRALFVRE